jgi:hypothetical protein
VGNFSLEEVSQLNLQHTKETGQLFTHEALALAYDFTRGQPWLVNALAYESSFKIKIGKNRQKPLTVDLIREAKENLVKGRVTHLDQLADKLKEPQGVVRFHRFCREWKSMRSTVIASTIVSILDSLSVVQTDLRLPIPSTAR